MREHPILFNSPMVQATLEDRKTVTRPVVTPQPAPGQSMVNAAYCGRPSLWLRVGRCSNDDPAYQWECPYGQIGDRLWVRETWAEGGDRTVFYRATETYRPFGETPELPMREPVDRWRPAIHMPRWASRITLEVAAVRVERLQSTSEKGASSEGVQELPLQVNERGAWWCADPADNPDMHFRNPRSAFIRLWESINGSGSWDDNPWVWVVEFKRVEQEAQS